MAVDRSGSGDVHIVEVKVGTSAMKDIGAVVAELDRIPARFKYLALFDSKNCRLDDRMLYAPDGMGRVGVIQVREDSTGNLSAEFCVRPERFRLESSVFKLIDRFTASRNPNLEIRP